MKSWRIEGQKNMFDFQIKVNCQMYKGVSASPFVKFPHALIMSLSKMDDSNRPIIYHMPGSDIQCELRPGDVLEVVSTCFPCFEIQ